ncbi:MAG: hypothetical protein GEU75_02670 [Dehalococcoidia bacterium]|nr:hypothetical protein [Dehalococcoidia bacterium]
MKTAAQLLKTILRTFRLRFGLTVNREGLTRVVLLTDKHVVKLPNFLGLRSSESSWLLFLQALVENAREAKASRLNHLVDNKLCPVVFAIPGGWLNVMKRADPVPAQVFNALDYAAFIRCGDYWLAVENKQSSFGFLDGRLVAIDYSGVFERSRWKQLFLSPSIRAYMSLLALDEGDGESDGRE